MQKIYSFLGGRKLTFALVILATITVFVFLEKMTAAEWSDLVMWIFGIYAGGNVGEYLAKRKK